MKKKEMDYIWNVFHGYRDDGFWWGDAFIPYHQSYVLANRFNAILEEL